MESGGEDWFTKTSCPGKNFGLLTVFAKLVVIGIFMPHCDGNSLSILNPALK